MVDLDNNAMLKNGRKNPIKLQTVTRLGVKMCSLLNWLGQLKFMKNKNQLSTVKLLTAELNPHQTHVSFNCYVISMFFYIKVD